VVHLKGLQINGMHPFMVPSPAANAINFVGVGNLIVEGSNIENFHGSAINFQSTSGGSVVVKDSTINNNDGSAIYVAAGTGTPTVSVNNVHLNNNGFGLNIGSSAQGSIRNSEINSAFYVAILVAPASGSATLTAETVLIHNGNQGIYSGFAAGTANVRISDVTIVDNTGSGMTYTGGSNITSFGNNRLNGNGAGNGTASIVLSQQ
jgi:hypothetical protein